MRGKREKKKKRRLPGLLMMLAVLVLTVHSSGPRGVAADSPVETAPPKEAPVPAAPAAREIGADPVPMEAEPEPSVPAGPVPEGEAVEDTYFDTAAFLGDSRTEGFRLYSGLEHGAYYYAVGATVESVFSKAVETESGGEMPLLDAMAQAEFDRIYVMLGVNELGWHGTDLYREQYARLIGRLRQDHPEAELVLQSILPVSAKQEAKGGYINNERIAAYNEVVEALATETGCWFLNTAEAVTGEDGCLVAQWTSDGVHLNVAGCRVWLDYLRTHAVGVEEAVSSVNEKTA